MKKSFEKDFLLREKEIGEFKSIDKNGMHFKIRCYDVDGLGSLMIMDMKAMLGIMKMTTAVFTPTDVDMPMISSDFISVMGNDTLLIELYDTCVNPWNEDGFVKVKESGSNLPDYDPGAHWYDSMRFKVSSFKKCKNRKDELLEYSQRYFDEYVHEMKSCPSCNHEDKLNKTAIYTNQLLEKGGPAVNQFKKMIGKKKTEEFLKKYMFVCE